jgi:hypothetical protein
MRKTSLFILLILTVFLVCQATSGYSKSSNNFVEIKTNFGSFPLAIPTLRLPELPSFALVSVSEATYPELPDWNYSRFIPKEPSWLDQSGKFYKEGIVQLFRGNLNVALKRFQAVTDNYPETPWFAPAWFWQGQITAKQEKFAQAEKTLTYFLDLIKQKKVRNSFLNTRISVATL